MTTTATPTSNTSPQADPERVVLNGRTDWRDPSIRYLGTAIRQPDGKYHVFAIVHGCLCTVAVRISFTPAGQAVIDA